MPIDLPSLVNSWVIALRAENKSPRTLTSYVTSVEQFLDWCDEQGVEPALDRGTVAAWVVDVIARTSSSTGRVRQQAVKRFSVWLANEGEIEADELAGVKPPKLDEKVIEPYTDDQLRALIAACHGKTLRDRRDEAVVRFMSDTGGRAGEVVAMNEDDVDLKEWKAIIRRGKGGRGRSIPFGADTAKAIDAYQRAKRRFAAATDQPALWVNTRTGKRITYWGLVQTLELRAEAAELPGFHLHRLRHTYAHRWLAAGGSEQGLMATAGWQRSDMLARYTKAQREARAAEEAKRLNLGSL